MLKNEELVDWLIRFKPTDQFETSIYTGARVEMKREKLLFRRIIQKASEYRVFAGRSKKLSPQV